MSANNIKRDQAALMLANGQSAVAIAKSIGTTPETISRWKMSPEFLAQINEHQSERLHIAREQLRASAKKAAETVNALMDSPTESIRLKAAISILRLSNIDQPQRIFSGIGSTDPLEILLELKRQVAAEQFIYVEPNSLFKKSAGHKID